MRWSFLGLLVASPVFASFENDVLRKGARHRQQVIEIDSQEKRVRDALLSKAVPLEEYNARLASAGLFVNRALEEQGDDFAVDYDYMYSFSGYSMKYAKCQPVQYFSENAVLAGEHSPMVTQDIVILRLCPQKSCSASTTYGCFYNYAEYAITLSDYVRIMLKFSSKTRDYTCEWCAACNGGNNQRRRRRLDDGANDGDQDNGGDENGEQQEEQQQEDGGEEEGQEEAQGDDAGAGEAQGDDAAAAAAGDDNVGDDGGGAAAAAYDDTYAYNAYNGCGSYDTYCYDYDNLCGENDDNYLDYDGYLDYLDCAEVKYNDYAYFVRPRCDGYSGTIKMAVYYDNYCIQYAGNDVSVKDLGLGFKEGFFSEFYSSECIDCSESENPPYFDASSTLCNLLHSTSAKCTEDLMYDLFEAEEDEATECSFIESLRFGAYDEVGQFSQSSQADSWSAEVTLGQKIWLGLALAGCVCFIIYACYLHHSMTNLLIKSLSHRELLPPSRTGNRRSPGARSTRSSNSKSRTKQAADEPDWDNPNNDKAIA